MSKYKTARASGEIKQTVSDPVHKPPSHKGGIASGPPHYKHEVIIHKTYPSFTLFHTLNPFIN